MVSVPKLICPVFTGLTAFIVPPAVPKHLFYSKHLHMFIEFIFHIRVNSFPWTSVAFAPYLDTLWGMGANWKTVWLAKKHFKGIDAVICTYAQPRTYFDHILRPEMTVYIFRWKTQTVAFYCLKCTSGYAINKFITPAAAQRRGQRVPKTSLVLSFVCHLLKLLCQNMANHDAIYYQHLNQDSYYRWILILILLAIVPLSVKPDSGTMLCWLDL